MHSTDTKTTNYSVVVPTLWRYPFFVDFLKDLVQFPMVDDIVIINNNMAATPVDDVFRHSKIRMIAQGENIGVNPAWNLGVAASHNHKVCIVNDDVIFDLKMFYHVDTVLSPASGVVGICPGVADFAQPPFVSGAIKVLPWTGQHTYGFGCLMFVHRSWWTSIPAGLRIYYGDNWIFDTCLAMGRTNYIITDALFHTPYATSTGQLTNIDAIHSVEQPIYHQAIVEFRAKQTPTA